MALLEKIAQMSAYCQQAIATQRDCADWDKALNAYLAALALADADAEFGQFEQAEESHLDTCYELEGKYGKSYRSVPEAAELARFSYDRLRADEERFSEQRLDPLFEAARELARTPAPTIGAALFKVLMIEREDLGNDIYLSDEAMGIVEGDFARLQGG